MKKIHLERLEKLAAHLEAGSLSVQNFNIRHFRKDCVQGKNGCGTAGCALGECPAVFPEDWTLLHLREGLYLPRLVAYYNSTAIEAAGEFFGLDDDETLATFWMDQERHDCPGKFLDENTTAAEMAQHLRALIEKKRPLIED